MRRGRSVPLRRDRPKVEHVRGRPSGRDVERRPVNVRSNQPRSERVFTRDRAAGACASPHAVAHNRSSRAVVHCALVDRPIGGAIVCGRAGCRTAVEREVALAAVASSGLRPSQGFSNRLRPSNQPFRFSVPSCAAPKERSLEGCSTWPSANVEERRLIAANDELTLRATRFSVKRDDRYEGHQDAPTPAPAERSFASESPLAAALRT
jgi:hypothetical protein